MTTLITAVVCGSLLIGLDSRPRSVAVAMPDVLEQIWAFGLVVVGVFGLSGIGWRGRVATGLGVELGAMVSLGAVTGMNGLVALPGGRPTASREFELAYLGPDGTECRDSLAATAAVRFEVVLPVRSFPSYRGQRSNSGLWWCSTTGGHVGYESWLERDHLALLDFDQDVVGIASQPFWPFRQDEGRRRSHAPDFFARQADGSGVVVDVRPAGPIRARDDVAFEATRRACSVVGWEFRLVHEPEPVRMANVRWLAGYRHPRCRREEVVPAALGTFAEPMGLMDGAAPARGSAGHAADGVSPAVVGPVAGRLEGAAVGLTRRRAARRRSASTRPDTRSRSVTRPRPPS